METINNTISLESLTLCRYLILSAAIFLQFFNFKIKVYQAAFIFTLLSVFVLAINTNFNLYSPGSDYSFVCKVAISPNNSLNEVISLWTQREFLFWSVLNQYGNIFKDCITTFSFYMAPLFYIFFYSIVKFSKLIFYQKDNFINISVVPFVVLYLPILLSFQNLLRSGASFAFLAALLYFLKIKDLTKALVCIFAGFFVHSSIVLFIPVILFFNLTKKTNKLNLGLVFLGYIPIALVTKSWFESGLGASARDTYATSIIYFFSILIIYFIQSIFPLIFKAFNNSKITNEFSRYSTFILTSLIPFMIFRFDALVLSRILICYSVLFLPIPIGILNTKLLYKKYNFMVLLASLVPSFWYF